ncbi:MAG TPA: TonB-dependent receptor [Ignavibacteria bacterium]|nr:TonB-dependent receptor [Ignavibacteria bacterium]HRK00215.1 TonB-dependent receptor [Ignavibacteria bacterium]
MKNLFRLTIIIIVIAITRTSFAQSGEISGIVTDSKSGASVEAASVSLLNGKDSSLVTGTETNQEGKFSFKNLPDGVYNIKIELIGYSKAHIRGIKISASELKTELAPVKLNSGETTTEEINVEAERSAIEFKADKKVFNVEQGMNVQGGSAVDVLKNIPSVAVDADGNISLRGDQNVKILVDGKPFGMKNSETRNSVLDQIPSNLIQSVELVTNPSAKYDAENSAGIINIILKKNEDFGYNGNIMLNAGSQDKYNGSLNFNFRKDKMNVFGSYDYRLYNYYITGENNREVYSSNSLYNQLADGFSRTIGNFLKGGFDYNISETNSLSYNLNYNYRDRRRDDKSSAKTLSTITGDLEDQYEFITSDIGDGYTLDMSLNHFLKFKNPGQTLSSELIFTKFKDNSTNVTTQNYIFPTVQNPDIVNRYNDELTNEGNISVDYVHPFSKEFRFETGGKIVLRSNDEDYRVENFDYNSNSFVNDTSQTNKYLYDENIYSLYGIYSMNIKKFNLSLGLRGEQTDTKGDLETTGEINKSSYFDLFPSLNASQKFSETEELQFSYSRRINRPSLSMINPFVTAFDPFNYFAGNPELRPEYINSLELGFLKYFEMITLNPSVFYSHTKDQMSRTRELIDSNKALLTFQNYGKNVNYGAELVVNSKPVEFISLNGSVSYYKNEIDATNLDSGFVNENYTWNGRLTANIYIPVFADLGLTYFYSGRNVFAQGVLEPFQSFDVSLKRDFMDKKLSFGLRFTDVFNTLKFDVKLNNTQNFNETFLRKRDTRSVFATLTYRFGTDTKTPEKKRRRVNDQPGNDGFGF